MVSAMQTEDDDFFEIESMILNDENRNEHQDIQNIIYDSFTLNNIDANKGIAAMANLIIATFLNMDMDKEFLHLLDQMKKTYFSNK
jgi:hypothetical protein